MIKRRCLGLFFVLGLLAQSFIDISAVHAAAPDNVSEFAGERCSPPRRGSGIVVGRYTGASNTSLTTQSFYRCFKSMNECQTWLYALRSKYTDQNAALIGCSRR